MHSVTHTGETHDGDPETDRHPDREARGKRVGTEVGGVDVKEDERSPLNTLNETGA